MAFINADTKKKIDGIVQDVRDYAVLVDEPSGAKVDGLDCQSGLGMHTEAESFRALSKDIEQGVFKTLVMGKFKNGKSTFINALVGKPMMAARATACTAVIATVEFGDRTNDVTVIYTDRPPVIMSLEKFTREFALSQADQELVEEGRRLDRFSNVSHVEMQSTDDLFADGMRLIDSPGLEEDNARTHTTNEFVPKANAIIFTMSATSLFSAKEKEYIAENFAGKEMRNVFFVINRIDNLTEGQLENSVKPSVKAGVADVFTDSKGRFNEQLYNSRVFFTNAYGALCVRTGAPYKVVIGKTEVPVPIELEDTGMLEFEAALRDFLNSEERIHATFSSTLTGMANTYQSAQKQAAANKAVRLQSKEEREKNAKLAQEKLDEAREKVEDIRGKVKNSGALISKKLYTDLLSYVQTDIPREFRAYLENSKDLRSDFGVASFAKLAGVNLLATLPIKSLKEKMTNEQVKILQPITNRINKYIKDQLGQWQKRAPILVDSDLRDLRDELDEQCADFDLDLEEAVNCFAYGTAKAPKQGTGFKAGLQSVLAMSNWDVSLAMESTAEGGMGWGTFLQRVGIQLGLDLAVTAIFGAPFIVIALAIEVGSVLFRSKTVAKDQANVIGAEAFKALVSEIQKQELDFETNVTDSFVERGEMIADTALSMVADAKNNMEKLLKENASDQKAADEENSRVDQNLQAMRDRINSVFAALYGRKPTEAEFVNLAKNDKKN